MLAAGFIRPNTGPYSSPLVLVKKMEVDISVWNTVPLKVLLFQIIVEIRS